MAQDACAAALVEAGAPPARAAELLALARGAEPLVAWRRTAAALRPSDPFAVHRLLHAEAFAAWDPGAQGPAPVWVPGEGEVAATNVGREGGMQRVWRQSVADPEAFWSAMLGRFGVSWDRAPERMLDASAGAEHARFMPGGRFNAAGVALAGEASRPAVVVGQEDGSLRTVSLAELRADAARARRALEDAGLGPGDAVAIDMPMSYASVALYLGLVAGGMVVVSIADSFAAEEIATRLRLSEAKAIVTQDVILRGAKSLPLYARVVEAGAPRAFVIAAGDALAVSLRDGDVAWADALAAAAGPEAPARPADVEAPTNVLFSSGTTGDPKAIVWTQITPLKAAADAWAHHDVRPGDVVAWPTNLGWMMGPWLIYASLLNGAAIALYEGAPHGRDFGAFVAQAGVTMLGVVPSLVKAWRASDCMAGLDWSGLRCFSSTGEASNAEEMHWLMSRAGYRPVVEYCGGTEIGGGYVAGSCASPQAASFFSTPAVGANFLLLGDGGVPADEGELALLPPMLGSSNRLLNRDHHATYFDGMPAGPEGQVLRRHGDWMERLPGGFYRAHGRVDDTMNLGGIKTSSAEIERAVAATPGVRETAAIALPPPGGGPSRLVIVAVPEVGAELEADALRSTFQRAIRAHLNPLFKVHAVVVQDALPRTASGKVMRRVLRKTLLAGS
ncbi:MAG: AMP-binding protein [Myxococcota bacterium]